MDPVYDTNTEHYRRFYARLKRARNMSYDEALEILGFRPGDHPSSPEVARAYKQKAVENHPDRGGSHEKMVEINLAKEILDGKSRPTYERYQPEPNPWRAQPPKPSKPKDVITFEAAKSKAGVPSNVEWLFVTATQRASRNYSGDESSRYDRAWVLYGRTADNHVFVGIEHAEYSGLAGTGDNGYSKWSMRTYEHGLSTKVTPSWLFSNIARAMSNMQWYEGRFNSKVVDIKGKDPLQNDRALTSAANGSATSIKNMLVNLGEVGSDDPSVANRKIPVELRLDFDYGFEGKVKPGFYPAPPSKSNTWDGKYHGHYYRVVLNISGRDYTLDERDTQTVLGLKAGGRPLMEAIFGTYWDRGGKKVLTRMPKGKVILTAFVERLKSLPGPAMELLQRAAGQMK